MAGHMMCCSECKIEKKEPFYGYYPFMSEDAICQEHYCKMEKVPISCDEYCIISRISRDVNFLEAMIKLKETDIIEYESRMSQFRNQVEQQKKASEVVNKNTVKCPKCGSTNIQIVPRKWSLLTGFMTNKTDRVCVNCKHKF